MKESDIRKLDLQLVQQFEVLMAERHVSRAAQVLGLSQPAMSVALGKLRRIFNDPLLTKTPGGMMPTPRAMAIAPRIHRALTEIEAALAPPEFDPAKDSRVFSVSVSELVAPLIIPRITALLGERAPGFQLVVWPNDPITSRDRLEDGTYDFTIDHRHLVSEGLHCVAAVTQRVCVICGPKLTNRVRDGLTLGDFVGLRHVQHIGRSGNVSIIERLVDEALASQKLERSTALKVFNIGYAISVVENSEMIFCLPRDLAEYFSKHYTLTLAEPPLTVRTIEMVLTWHERSHTDVAHLWLRGEMRKIFAELRANSDGSTGSNCTPLAVHAAEVRGT